MAVSAPSASRLPSLFHDVRFDQLAPSPSPVSLQLPSGGGIIQAQKVLHAVVAAARGTGGQPSGMIPSFHLISSWFLLHLSPPSRTLHRREGPAVHPVTLSALSQGAIETPAFG